MRKKEEKATMARMLEASGRKDSGATADEVGDGVATETPTPTKTRRLSGKQPVPTIDVDNIEPKTAKPPSTAKPPCCSVERSRSQVLCRTGIRGAGQSHSIKYGEGQKYADEDAALIVAREWVIAEKKKRGFLP